MLPPQNGDDPKGEVPLDNQYEGDDLPQEELSNPSNGMDMSRDLDRTKDMDQTRDAMNAPAALKDLEDSENSSQQEAPKKKKKKRKVKKKKKKQAPSPDGPADEEAEEL